MIRVLFLSLAIVAAAAAEEPGRIVRVGLPQYPPVASPDSQTPRLFDSVIQAVARAEGWQLALIPVTQAQGRAHLRAGTIDLLAATPYSVDSTDCVFTRETVISTWAQVILPQASRVQGLLDLNHLSVAVCENDPYGPELDRTAAGLSLTCRILGTRTYDDVLKAVAQGWADAGVVDRLYLVHTAPPREVRLSSLILAPVQLRFAARPEDKHALIDIVDYHLRNMKDNPASTYSRLMGQLLCDETENPAGHALRAAAALAGAVALALVWIIYRLRLRVHGTAQALTRRDQSLADAIASKQRAEAGVRHADNLLENVFSSMRDGVLVVNAPWQHILRSNRRAAELLAVAETDIPLLPPSVFFPSPDAFAAVESQAHACMNGTGFLQLECRLRRQDGKPLPVDLCISPLRDHTAPAGAAFLLVFRDVTDRLAAEETIQQTERRLRQAEKMEAIGTLAGGIAHDFNNVLTPILMCCDMLRDGLPPGDARLEDIVQIRQAAHRARDLVQQILAFSRRGEGEQRPLHVTPIVKETIRFLRAALPATVEIQSRFLAERDRILADPVQVHQVIMNLATNAAHAMQDHGGVLTIATAEFTGSPRGHAGSTEVPPGHYLQVDVSDTGHGMSPGLIDRIFDPFFTTKKPGEGTGMGLAVVHGIVKTWHGTVAVDSTPGAGTTFRVFIPFTEAAVAEMALPSTAPIPHGRERVLVVDDEPLLAKMLVRALARLGYAAEMRQGGHEALALLCQAPETFAAVVSDQTMPGMTGLQLAHEIGKLMPNLPVILCSGYSEGLLRADVEKAGIRAFLNKPFTVDEVAVALRSVLDQQPRAVPLAAGLT